MSGTPRPETASRPEAWRRRAVKLFAPVVSITVVGLLIVLFRVVPPLLEESWLRNARAAHAEWTGTGAIAGAAALDARSFLGGMRRIGTAPHLPDLTGARLSIARVSYVAAAGGGAGAIHAGYAGPGKCRVSLWIAPTTEAGDGALESHGDGLAMSWRAGGLRHVLVTADMDDDRFRLIAGRAREMTLARQGADERTRAALRLSALISRPCER